MHVIEGFIKLQPERTKEAREAAARVLQKTKAGFGIDAAGPLKGAMPCCERRRSVLRHMGKLRAPDLPQLVTRSRAA
jgi:hypothetical protein